LSLGGNSDKRDWHHHPQKSLLKTWQKEILILSSFLNFSYDYYLKILVQKQK
jgi:hypothetical protein